MTDVHSSQNCAVRSKWIRALTPEVFSSAHVGFQLLQLQALSAGLLASITATLEDRNRSSLHLVLAFLQNLSSHFDPKDSSLVSALHTSNTFRVKHKEEEVY